MPLWTVCFDATVIASIEAETDGEAQEAAEAVVAACWDEDLRTREGVDWTLGRIFAIRNEQTGLEIRK